MSFLNKIFKQPPVPQYAVDDSIFKEYDIRGIYNETLFDRDAFLIGRAVASFVGENKTIVVGYDGRISSNQLTKKLISGLVSSGIRVINIGLCHTPLVYFAVATQDVDMGIMITGSHNPKNHNGFKLVSKTGAIFGDQVQNIRDIIRDKKFVDGIGREVLIQNLKNEYVQRVLQNTDIYGNINIAWDMGNGATGEVVRKIVRQLPGNHIFLNAETDGNFPGRDPDPTQPENLSDLINAVKTNSLDLGIAFDGDGDRIVVIDGTGRFIYGDQLLSIFARSVLKGAPNSSIIVDVKSSKLVTDDIREHGGIPIMEKSGHSIIKAKMRDVNAVLAGEMSGHIFFADKWYGFDDAVYSAVRLIEIHSQAKNVGENIFDNIPSGFNTPEVRINCESNSQFEIVEAIKDKLKKNGLEPIEIDGVRIELPTGWWLIRASNTQNQITVRVEADSEDHLFLMKEEVVKYINEAGINFQF